MIMKGQKRKFPAEDVEDSESSSPTWESQRQFVFSVSMSKYQHGQELPEPSLRRSVLIANTLRQINFESCRASAFRNQMIQPHSSSSSPHQVTAHESVFAEASAGFHSNASSVSIDEVEEGEDWGSMSADSDFSLSACISSTLTALEATIDGSHQAAQRTPLRSLENLSGSSHGGVGGVQQGVQGYGTSWEQHEEFKSCETNLEVMSSSYLNDVTMEELFQDIDTSLLEKDMGVLGLRGSGDGYPSGNDLLYYLPPFSTSSAPSFSQNLKCLPSFSSFSPLSPS